jgi:glycosyltransferase involved in cell wall biosynthesis
VVGRIAGGSKLKIAFDGGAFQQGIEGGILNVAVGLLNAATEIDPSFSYVLVGDPRLGLLREDALAKLTQRPEIVYGEVCPSYDYVPKGMITEDPRIRFEVDGRIFPSKSRAGIFTYEGPKPEQSFHILSRSDRPADTMGSSDTRNLGVAVQGLTVTDSSGTRHISIRNPKILDGFHGVEDEFRWSDGRGQIPVEFFESSDIQIKVDVGVSGVIPYRLLDGAFDDCYLNIYTKINSNRRKINAALLENKLLDLGASIYFVNHFIPAKFDRLITVSFLHDMIPVIFPDFFMADAQFNFENNIASFKRSAHVFANSRSSLDDLLRLERIPADQVTNVGIDIGSEFSPASLDVVSAAREKRGLMDRPYIICVGTLEPRKNHVNLARAFNMAFRGREFPFDLVVIGKPGWGYEGFRHSVDELGLGEAVHILSDVANDELVALYSGALFCAYPSIYEGFGLPVLEAMACGCPVLTSNVSSMPEIAAEAAIYIDPHDVASIARGLALLADDMGLRRMLAERGLRNRERYNWKLTARRVLDRLQPFAISELG